MPRIKNIRYRTLIDLKEDTNPLENTQSNTQREPPQLMDSKEFHDIILPKVIHRHHQKQAEVFMILLFWLGRRPVELIDLAAHQFNRAGQSIRLHITAAKGGKAYPLLLPLSNPDMVKVLNYWETLAPRQFLFWGFRGMNKKKTTKYVVNKKTNPETRSKEYGNRADKISWWVKKWSGLPPYFYRHNRFTQMAHHGATIWDIKAAKGARSIKSVEAYVSEVDPEKISKYFK